MSVELDRPGVGHGSGPAADLRRRLIQRPRYPQIVLVTVLSGLFAIGFTITVLAVSIPTIADDLGSDEVALTWIITGPILAFGVLGPAAGKAGDVFGHRRLYLWSTLLAAGFSLLTALAPSAGTLVGFRILGAAAGAATGPSSQAMINRLYPRAERVRAMGWFSFVAAGAPVLGVVAGGPVVEHLSWRLIFWFQAPLLVGVFAVAWVVLPDLTRGPRRPFDVAGAVTLAGGVTSVLFALNRGSVWGWSHPAVAGPLVVAPLLLWLFVKVERRASDPLVPLELFRRRNFVAPGIAQMLMNFAYMGGFIITPLFLLSVYGYGETRVGLISIARPIAFALSGPIAGYLAMRSGERRSALVGGLAIAASMVGLARLGVDAPDWEIMAVLALSGIGLGASSPAMQATVANAVEEERLGVAGAMMQLMMQIGIAVGIQVMQTTQVLREPSVGVADAYKEAYLVGFVVAVAGMAAAALVRDRTDDPSILEGAPTR